MVYGSKYEAILENAVAVPGRVGMAECSLDLIFFNYRQTIFFWLGGGAGADFSNSLNKFFYRQSESIFCAFQLSTIAIRPYTLVKLQFHQISKYLISILIFSHKN